MIGNWYMSRRADGLTHQTVKYHQRSGWTHRDLPRLPHPITTVPELCVLFEWIVRDSLDKDTPELVRTFLVTQEATTVATWVALVREHQLTWEMLPSATLCGPEVWEALLDAGIS